MPAAMRENLAWLNPKTQPRRQIGDDNLAPYRIGEPGHSGKCDTGILLQDLLDLGRRDVDARALDHFGAASRILERSILTKRTKITGPEVAIGRKRRRVELRTRAEITFAEIALDLYLSDFIPLAFAAQRRVPDPHLHAWQGRTLTPCALLQRPIVWSDTAVTVVLSGAINVADLRCAELFRRLEDVLRSTDRNTRSHRCGPARVEPRVPDQGIGHCGQRIDCRALVSLDQVERAFRVEVSLQHERRTVAERRRNRIN